MSHTRYVPLQHDFIAVANCVTRGTVHLSVSEVVLLSSEEGLHVLGRHQPGVMAQRHKLPAQTMRVGPENSCGFAEIGVVQPINSWERNDLPHFRWMDGSAVG